MVINRWGVDETAINLATVTSQKAVDLATATAKTATELASKTAETTAVINTNIEWMKQSLAGIETTLKEMNNMFVNRVEFTEVVRVQDDHENRTRVIEQSIWKWMGVSSAIATIFTIIMSFVLKVIKI